MNCEDKFWKYPINNIKYEFNDPEFYYNRMFNYFIGKDFETIKTKINIMLSEIYSMMFREKNEHGEYTKFTDNEKKFLLSREDDLIRMKNYFKKI